MLTHPALDVVYVSTPIGLHFSMAEKALKAGKEVWCEKPLTCDFRETQALVALAEDNGKVLTESFMYLHHPQFKRVKQFVDESVQSTPSSADLVFLIWPFRDFVTTLSCVVGHCGMWLAIPPLHFWHCSLTSR